MEVKNGKDVFLDSFDLIYSDGFWHSVTLSVMKHKLSLTIDNENLGRMLENDLVMDIKDIVFGGKKSNGSKNAAALSGNHCN